MNDGGIRRSKSYVFPQIHESTPTYPAVPPEEDLRVDWTASAQHKTKGPQKDGRRQGDTVSTRTLPPIW